jgi:hypothetical protein
MAESLRGLGYSTPTALADIIDNSVSAGASIIDVRFEWNGGTPYIQILDDGRGMKDAELENAMQLGAKSPLEERSADDLGRFGLGLKTASFSQGRRLTVASRAAGSEQVCLRWDLDLLSRPEDDGWYLYEGPDPSSTSRLAPLSSMNHGTLVLWENLDRITGRGFTVQDYLDLQGEVERHLAMTFHRLLDDGLEIRLNNTAIKGWDPFMTGHPSKAWDSGEIRLGDRGEVRVQCNVLPHKDMLKPKEIDQAGGPGGWTMQQGFYIYRNKRLLVAGGWMGLEQNGRTLTRDEPHRLARIRLDIPNWADAEWKIDIRKSSARAPARLRKQLLTLAQDTREKARKVFAHRGQWSPSSAARAVDEAWVAEKSGGVTRYRISRRHEIVKSLLERAGPLKKDIQATLRIIEETVPIQRIWLDTAEDRETPRNGLVDSPTSEILDLLSIAFTNLTEQRKLPPNEARAKLLLTAPFDRFPELVAQLPVVSLENI